MFPSGINGPSLNQKLVTGLYSFVILLELEYVALRAPLPS